MVFLSADQRELFLPLIEGIHENPPWGAFMRNLVARTYARRAFLTITLANADSTQDATVLHVAAPRATQEPPLDFRAIADLGLHPYGALRPERIYSLDEMLDYDDRAQLARQREALDAMGVRYGRWLRVSVPGAGDAWLLLVREREDFSASAVSTLATVAPHLSAALRALVALVDQRLQTSLAQDALARLGVGEMAFDRTGRLIAADPAARAMLPISADAGHASGIRLQLLPDVARAVEAACAHLSAGPDGGVTPVLVDQRRGLWLLLRKADLVLQRPHVAPAVIGIVRSDRREDARAAVKVIQLAYGLSAREAALAHALTRGESILDAGKALRLTPETARNYSKRIYAKTRTKGQADLVRLILGGLAPFC